MTTRSVQYNVTLDDGGNPSTLTLTPPYGFASPRQLVVTNYSPYIAIIENLDSVPSTMTLVPGMTQLFSYTNVRGAPKVQFVPNAASNTIGQAYITVDWSDTTSDFTGQQFPALATVFNAAVPSTVNLGPFVNNGTDPTIVPIPSWVGAVIISVPSTTPGSTLVDVEGTVSGLDYTGPAGINVLSQYTGWFCIVPVVPGLDPSLTLSFMFPTGVTSENVSVVGIPQYVDLPLPAPTIYKARADARSSGTPITVEFVGPNGNAVSQGPWLLQSASWNAAPGPGAPANGEMILQWDLFISVYDFVQAAISDLGGNAAIAQFDGVITPWRPTASLNGLAMTAPPGWLIDCQLTAIQLG